MARRKGSGRGNLIVSSRQKLLVTSREKSNDDKKSGSNKFGVTMESAAAMQTSKHYKKAAKQNKNNQVSNTRRATAAAAEAAASAATASTTTIKQAYRSTSSNSGTTQKSNSTTTTTVATTTAEAPTTQLPINSKSAQAKLSELSDDGHHSDNSISENSYELISKDRANAIDRKMTLQHLANSTTSSVSKPTTTATTTPNSSSIVNNHLSDVVPCNALAVGNDDTTTEHRTIADDWTSSTNLRYLHKKFKRLASTTDSEKGDVAVARTTSLSSNSSLSPPPPPQMAAEVMSLGPHLINGHMAFKVAPTNSEFCANLEYANIKNNNHEESNNHKILAVAGAPRTRTPLSNSNINYASNATLSPAIFAQHRQQTQPTIPTPSATEPASTTTVVTTTISQNAAAQGEKSSRFVCPFCSMSCAKPSVLQKHIRAHTNERPYPCDNCGIAFKTKSNLYKHCRSRSHAARLRGLDEPANETDGLSDHDVDGELSNSSSELLSVEILSRTDSPYDETMASPTASPSSLSAAKSAYLQQPKLQQNMHQLPLGSPAAGTLPPAPPADTLYSGTAQHRLSLEYKPYKPKFHNASLYAPGSINKDQQQQNTQHQQQQAPLTQLQEHKISTQQQPSLSHPTLSPSTQMKLNNHINSHQLQLQLQHQQQQLHAQQSLLLAATANPVALSVLAQPPPLPASVFYLGQPPYYNPTAAAMHQHALAIQQLQFQQHFQLQQHQQQHQQQQEQQQQQQQQRHQEKHQPHSPILKTPPQQQQLQLQPQQPQQLLVRSNSQQTAVVATTAVLPVPATPPVNLSSFACSSGGMQFNVEKVQEHISKLISQNEAIVENKEILLQKKYPKQLNRSRSFNCATNSSTNSSNSNSAAAHTNNNISNQLGGAKVSLAHAIVQKQQQQQSFQQQQQHQQQPQSYFQHSEPVNELVKRNTASSDASFKGLSTSTSVSNIKFQQLPAPPSPKPQPLQQLQYRHDPAATVPKLDQHQPLPPNHAQPLNLSAKYKPSKQTATVSPTAAAIAVNKITTTASPAPPNNSIIKNLLLNARGLAVPIGEGDDAVYSCPICASEFRSAEELKHHNSTYCQDANSSTPISPASSPSTKFFRSNSITISLPELKSHMANSKNPLSLAKLAWSQLKTKPSSLVLSRLSAAQSPSRTSTVTAPINTSSTGSVNNNNNLNHNINKSSIISGTAALNPPSTESSNIALRFVDAPLPSPGPLLGKTPLVDYAAPRKASGAQVIITKMHEDRLENMVVETPSKRAKMSNESPATAFTLSATVADMLFGANQELQFSAKEERLRRFTSSGGTMIPISECHELDKSPKMIRTPLLSGGSFQEMSPRLNETKERKLPTIHSYNNSLLHKNNLSTPHHFQFPPINSITSFNPLTLPSMSKNNSSNVTKSGSNVGIGDANNSIPYIPGIPGPGSLSLLPPPQHYQRETSPNVQLPSPNESSLKALSPFGGVQNLPSEFCRQPPTPTQRNALQWNNRLSINKTTALSAVDNALSKKQQVKSLEHQAQLQLQTPTQAMQEVRHFNFDSVNISTHEALAPLHVDTPYEDVIKTTRITATIAAVVTTLSSNAKSKFLRPTSLPLKPGTFTPKRHHGITPTANTLPLISPETPRPSKSCVQLYLNGHAYTYLGLKCSTKMFYCTVNCPQPSYVAGMHMLSMYSVWQVCEENQPHPLGLKPKQVMALYDSRQQILGKGSYTAMAGDGKLHYSLVTSQQIITTCSMTGNGQSKNYQHQVKLSPAIGALSEANLAAKASEEAAAKKMESGHLLVGGYESHEDYTYIRGRGRGRYVCSECGIRCKKPSMLKKHIRTHTDVRPFTCSHCNFSFKTKGNLTKHMQSKTHFKKCIELGINPGPMPADGEFLDVDVDFDQQSSTSAGGRTSSMAGESDSDDYSDNDTESSDTDESKSRVKEHEAARGLLSLSMTPPIPLSTSPYPATVQETPVPAASPANSISSSAGSAAGGSQPKRQVCSFTSPKPPFDYQKQEQYYSNPEESKPKRNVPNDEGSAPIDLTKPRSMASILDASSMLSDYMPLQKSNAQQMRDVIFGAGNNESGFMKTLISVSDKVRISAEMEEQVKIKSGGNDFLLQTYIKEQALQHAKIKQSQFSQSYLATSTATSSCISSTFVATPIANSKIPLIIKELPNIEVHEAKTPDLSLSQNSIKYAEKCQEIKIQSDRENIVIATTSPSVFVSVPVSVLNTETQQLHNANLPAAVQKPDAIDFSGVLSTSNKKSSQSAVIVVVGEDGFKMTTNSTSSNMIELQPAVTASGTSYQSRVGQPPPPTIASDTRPTCNVCNKTFQRQHQLTLHMNIHYMERKFKCEPCSISFRTQGHLQKHERSEAHRNKVMMTSTFGVPTTSNPRPFECTDCKIAFRIHGHLAKHLRSKTHVQKLECLQKLPFGTYAEIERAGISLTEIDTSDCENSLISLKLLAQKLLEKDPGKLSNYTTPSGMLQLSVDTPAGGQDSASEDGFSAANSAAASAIASLDNDSAENTPKRASSMSEDESIANGLGTILGHNHGHVSKRRLPGSFGCNSDESDYPQETESGSNEKRARSNKIELELPIAVSTAPTSN